MKNNMMSLKMQVSYKIMAFFAIYFCFLFSIVPIISKDFYLMSQGTKSLVLHQLINYTIPTVKVTSFDEEDYAGSSLSINNILQTFMGIDFSTPLAIVSREIPSLQLSNNVDSNLSSNQFELNSKDITNTQDGQTTPKIQLDNNSSGIPNTNVKIFNPKLKQTLNTKVPEVLIYHSHTTESYKPGGPNTFDDTVNVVSVGDSIVSQLQNGYGISAINDRTVHDATDYAGSYIRSRVTLKNYLKKYGDFKIIIDLHRDSVTDKNAETLNINGENVAKFMMVLAKKNPHFDNNMKIANFLENESDDLFPGLCKGIDTSYNYGMTFFNQDLSNNAILIEVGADINTTTEANATGKYIARLIAEYLKQDS